MPNMEGRSLREHLDREKQLSLNEALRLTREIAAALDYAHRHKVVHRDVKPENVLLHEGSAMVADFGIGKALSSNGSITRTGMSLGTPAYMSPEQASGDTDVDGRSDLYSLGRDDEPPGNAMVSTPSFSVRSHRSDAARAATLPSADRYRSSPARMCRSPVPSA